MTCEDAGGSWSDGTTNQNDCEAAGTCSAPRGNADQATCTSDGSCTSGSCDGGGHTDSAGGKLTETFLKYTKLFDLES